MQRNLGTINFVAKYVFGMQPKLQPLYQLLHKETEFKWTKDHQQIFEKMKQAITKQLEITMPDTSTPLYNLTDASKIGIGAALLQQHPTERRIKLNSAISRLFKHIEMRLSAIIRESSAIISVLTEYEFLRIKTPNNTILRS